VFIVRPFNVAAPHFVLQASSAVHFSTENDSCDRLRKKKYFLKLIVGTKYLSVTLTYLNVTLRRSASFYGTKR